MLPLQQAYEVKESVLAYIEATFRFKEEKVHDAFYQLIRDPENGLFKGPYISLKTPFVKATPEEAQAIPLDIKPTGFLPHKHQLRSFERLTSRDGHLPQPTLLTTGTGSGKTECFLYPILDFCYRLNKDGIRKGIKVIIMYPMNALATDQATRLAEAIYNDERLRGVVTAGLFIGEGAERKAHATTMGEHNIIEDRDTIINTAPDILLTNFKMLDYGLMQQQYTKLWHGNANTTEPMLRYLVLDELHTYDGAQGTDVANLIRRLKLKLSLPKHHLCPVGTSATISGGAQSKQQLISYASDVFGEDFDDQSVIGEDRVAISDFFDDYLDNFIPSEADLQTCNVQLMPMPDYIQQVRRIWLPGAGDNLEAIGEGIRSLTVIRDLLSITQEHVVTVEQLEEKLGNINPAFQRLRIKGKGKKVIETILALVSEARDGKFPLLFLQIQLWQRELSGVVRYVQREPEFTWRNSLDQDGRIALPIYFCRDCGASGWISTKNATDLRFATDLGKINKAFMSNDKDIVLINTYGLNHRPIPDYLGDASTNVEEYIRPRDLTIVDSSDDEAMRIVYCSKRRLAKKTGSQAFVKNCPECNSNSLAIVGGRTSTLSSVAISQIMASDFDESDIAQRKVLTFTNSVQDAAHQAGFYEARTYRFLLRQSIQQYLKYRYEQTSEPIRLTELQEGFKSYWKEHLPGDEYYYRFLPTDLLNQVDLNENYRDANGQFIEAFKKEFDLRIDWEICAEFGLMAQRGRTLEKVGSSACFFDRDQLEDVFTIMQPWMRENQLDYVADDRQRFLLFLNGLLHRMRLRGAVDHPYYERYRGSEFKQVNLNWSFQLQHIHFLNKKFFGNVQFPKFLLTHYERDLSDTLDITEMQGNNVNWYAQFFQRSLEGSQFGQKAYREVINDFYQRLLDAMTEAGLVNRATAANGNYAICPEAILIEPRVKHIKCEDCQSMLCVAQSDTLAEGIACLNYNCNGSYTQVQRKEDNYYKRVYDRDKAPRIYAHEHTGLLERSKREEIENDFKLHPHFNSINALSATSTLEMGIDIGTLNVVGNTDIPPKPSNFLQRIGRAGRKSGTALVLNYAHSDGAHDMFYFADPLGMMEGEVQTPGCFLQAKDILRRHFFAFCIDSWTSADQANTIPALVKLMSLRRDTLASPDFFLTKILSFIDTNRDTLLAKFKLQYPPKAEESLEKLQETVVNGDFTEAIKDAFRDLIERYDSTRRRQNDIESQINALAANDPRRKALKDELKPLKREISRILNTNVIEFMTNAGLLPNYAFPETGVKLEATVYKQKPAEDDSITELSPDTFELVRPASNGLKDLAPGNRFYSQKYEMLISGVNTFDWNKTIGRFRYCCDCDCIAAEGTDWFNQSTCPKCGSPSWGGSGNIHHFLRFTGARSSMKRTDAAINDRSDERERENFHIMKHFRFNYHGAIRSYGLKNVGFGIEFCPEMDLMEVNYGPQMASQSQIEIEGVKVPSRGFIVCRECGKTVTKEVADAEECHYPFCHHKDVPYPPHEEADMDVFMPTYLYRRTQTEAIKVLLPVHLLDTEATVQMFKAGLELGMRYYYQSSPDHIRIDVYREVNQATRQFDNYLIIYDTIPGGTGYLSRLQSPEEFSKLLTIAYEHIRDCECQRHGKDGCYHCILSYANQYIWEQLSRDRAEELFKKLVDELANWEEIDGSIGTVTQSGVIEDSELERQFILDMDHYCRAHNGWTWSKQHGENGLYHYILDIKQKDRALRYVIRPQYQLGEALGVALYTVPDFQIICIKAMVNGQNIETGRIPQWSIYLDGYSFHANSECMRFYSDFEKREAIRHNAITRMNTWTLTWDDLNIFEGQATVAEDGLYNGNSMNGFANETRLAKNSFERLLLMLTLVDVDSIRFDIYKYLVCKSSGSDNICPPERVEDAIFLHANGEFASEVTPQMKQGWSFFVKNQLLQRSSLVTGSAWVLPKQGVTIQDKLEDKVCYDFQIVPNLSAINKEDWNDFWRQYNLLQFFKLVGDEETSIEKQVN